MHFFNLLRLIDIDIVQIMMSLSTLYLFTFSSYMQKPNMFSVPARVFFRNTQICLTFSSSIYKCGVGSKIKVYLLFFMIEFFEMWENVPIIIILRFISLNKYRLYVQCFSVIFVSTKYSVNICVGYILGYKSARSLKVWKNQIPSWCVEDVRTQAVARNT